MKNYLAAHQIPVHRISVPLDRVLMKFGLSDRPLVFLSFSRIVAILALYWTIAVPLTFFSLLSLVFQTNFFSELSVQVMIQLMVVSALFSIGFATLMARNLRKRITSYKIPAWEEFRAAKSALE